MDLTTTLLLITAGVAAGTVGSMVGVGGGMIIIPLLTQYYGWDFEHARATSLLAVIATSGGVAVATGRERFVNQRLALVLALPTVVIALVNALVTSKVNVTFLYGLFAAVLLTTSLLMWRGQDPDERDGEEPGEEEAEAGPYDGAYVDPKSGERVSYQVRYLKGILGISGLAGAISGLLGVGGGVFQVPAMTLLARVPIRAAAATSNLILGMTAAASLPIYFGRGHVRPLESAAVLLGVLAGAFVGTAISARIGGTALRRSFSFLLIALAWQMGQKALS